MLNRLNDMGFELREAVLHTNQILAIVVFLLDLLVQAVQDGAAEDIGIFGCGEFGTDGVEGGGVLAEEFDVFLGSCPCLINGFAALAGALGELFGFVFDFGVEAFEDGEDGGFELFLGFVVGVVEAL